MGRVGWVASGLLAAVCGIASGQGTKDTAVQKLRKRLDDPKTHVEQIASELWSLGPAVLPEARGWLKDEDPRVRACVIMALPGIAKGNAGVGGDVATAMKDPRLRSAALDALLYLDIVTPEITLQLGAMIRDETTRKDAVRLCKRIRWPKKPDKTLKKAIQKLKKSYTDLWGKIRRTAYGPEFIAGLYAIRNRPVKEFRLVVGRRARLPETSKRVREAVDRGLMWLTGHQDKDGRWDSDAFMKHDPEGMRCTGPGRASFDVGVTALALMAFLGAGHGPRSDSKHAATVRRGLDFLVRSQAENGRYGPAMRESNYGHAYASIAIAEAWLLDGDPLHKASLRRAVAYLDYAQNGSPGHMDEIELPAHMATRRLGWRYGPRPGDNDTTTTAVAIRAMKLAESCGIEVDPEAFVGALEWFDKLTDPEFGQVGYIHPGGESSRLEGLAERFPPDKAKGPTAMAIFCRALLGRDPAKTEVMHKSTERCVGLLPRWEPGGGTIDMLYWYWGSLALYQMGGDAWDKWWNAAVDVATKHQRPTIDGPAAGSWDPIGAWGPAGGRVFSTALMLLVLEAETTYARRFPGK